jgi:hypothetical protein
MNNYGSVSMLLDDKKTKDKFFVKEKRNNCWLSDNNVNKCYDCDVSFGFFLRKHHCRSCGRIFCYKCSDNNAPLLKNLESYPLKPRYLSHKLKDYYSREYERVCDKCYMYINEAKDIETYINILLSMELDVIQVKKMLYVNKMFYKATSFYVSHFREIQYKLTYQTFTELEKRILWINRKLINGHNKLIFQFINAFDETLLPEKLLTGEREVPCYKLMCTRSCSESLDIYDTILLLSKSDIELRKFFVNKLEHIDLKKLICFIPLLVKFLLYDNRDDMVLLEFLINKCTGDDENSFHFRNKVFCEINYNISTKYHSDFYWIIKKVCQKRFGENIGEYIRDQLLLSESFIVDLKDMYFAKNKKKYLKGLVTKYQNHFYFPLKNCSFNDIDYENIKIFDSFTKPIMIPLISNDIKYHILLKKEDVKKDSVIINIIKLSVEMLKDNPERKLVLDIDLYDILPINSEYGFVEFKSNSNTLFNINESGVTLYRYIIEKNKTKSIDEIRKRFIDSLSIYCVITYLFGVGDRHLENIMISDNGEIFHIDYSYIFSDPKNIEVGMRITKDMVDFIGGIESEEYQKFKEQTIYIYNYLRKYTNIFLEMLMLLENELDKDFIINEIIKRFEPNEKSCNAQLHLVTTIENSTNSYGHNMSDWMHYIYKKGGNIL